MKKIILPLILILGAGSLSAQDATTEPVGFNKVVCLAGSDTIVSVPFKDSTNSITGTIIGTPTASGAAPNDIATIGVTGFPAGTYNEAYYVHFLTGNLQGGVFQVSSNTATTLLMHLHGEDVAQLTAGDTFKIYKFWTLGTLFPAGNTAIVESASTLPFQRKTEVLLYDRTGLGINRSVSKIFFQIAAGWIDNDGLTGADDTIVWPDSPLIIRHKTGADTTFIAKGIANIQPESIPLFTSATSSRDNIIAVPRPVPVALKDLKLISSGAFLASSGQLPFNRKDLLLIFDNASANQNKSPSLIYFHDGTNWIDNNGLTIADDELLSPTQGIIIRKVASTGAVTTFWDLPQFATAP